MQKRFLFLFCFVTILLTGCKNNLNDISDTIRTVEKVTDTLKDVGSSIKNVKDTITDTTKDIETNTKSKYKYSGKYHEVVGKAKFKYKITNGITYGKTDKYNRPTYATALITVKLYNKEKNEDRETIKVKPCGWTKNFKTVITHKDGTSYKGWFWNKSHMIADSLGGSAVYENLITGTRPQNVGGRKNDGGMAYMENKIRNYFNQGNIGNVKYSVENVYNSNKDKLPIYSIVNALSDDNKINEEVIVYNSAEGFNIDYKTGKATKK